MNMVRKRVEIKRIEDKAKRQTTLTKRRKGLFRKAEELGKRCDAGFAVITFSKAGNLYATGNPTMRAVINHYTRDKFQVDGKTNEKNQALQALVAETNNENESTLLPLLTDKKHNTEMEKILAKVEAIKSKISHMVVEDSKLHDMDQTITELEGMEDALEVIRARNT